MARVNSTKIVSRFFDSSAHSLPITFYNRVTPANVPDSTTPDTPYYPNEYTPVKDEDIVSESGATVSWDSITTDKYKFDSTLTKTRVKAVWSADISNWHYPKTFHPGFEYAIWGRINAGRPWLLYDKVSDDEGTLSYTFPNTKPADVIVMIHNPNYPPTTDIIDDNVNPKPDCWHFLVGSV